MPRYTTRQPRAVFDDNEIEGWGVGVPHVRDITVYQTAGQCTGLLDKDGNKLVKHPDQIGYVRF